VPKTFEHIDAPNLFQSRGLLQLRRVVVKKCFFVPTLLKFFPVPRPAEHCPPRRLILNAVNIPLGDAIDTGLIPCQAAFHHVAAGNSGMTSFCYLPYVDPYHITTFSPPAG